MVVVVVVMVVAVVFCFIFRKAPAALYIIHTYVWMVICIHCLTSGKGGGDGSRVVCCYCGFSHSSGGGVISCPSEIIRKQHWWAWLFKTYCGNKPGLM